MRGAGIGLILCVGLILVLAAAVLGFNIVRDYLEVHVTAGVRTGIRKDASEDANKRYVQKWLDIEKEREAQRPAPKAPKPAFTDGDGR
jgi:hypothetical protein